ncbi:MAG: pirin family protein [Elainellaceae cyanobacterium]
MLTIRPAQERGAVNFGWLDSRHTFSFGSYYDPRHMGFSSLRVINEDRVEPGQGFGTHGHRDMEIISYVLEGELEHKDSLGTGSIIRPGDVQRMSAGTGIRHSEFNPSKTEGVHFLQIWIEPAHEGLAPSYEQVYVPQAEKQGQLRLIGSPEGRDGSVTIHQDVSLSAAVLGDGDRVSYDLRPERAAWIQVVKGAVALSSDLDGQEAQRLAAGDGVAVSSASRMQLTGASKDTELLLFDLAA